MATALKILGQSAPGASAYVLLYTVPTATTAVISSISICNTDNASYDYIRVSLRVAGASDDPKDKLYYDLPLGPNDTFIATIGATLGETDEVYVWSQNGHSSFIAFGQENT